MKAYADKHLLLFGGGEPWEQEVLNEIVFEYVEDKIDYFKSLPVPEGAKNKREVRAMINAFEDGLREERTQPGRPGRTAGPFEKGTARLLAGQLQHHLRVRSLALRSALIVLSGK